jgi:hypothetical protein
MRAFINTLRMFGAFIVICWAWQPVFGDAFSRMQLEKLRAVRASLESLRDQWQAVTPIESELKDFRAQIHVHSHFSHDSQGSIEEIIQAAKSCNTQIIMFSDHPSEEYDFFLDGYQGMRDGVLLIPGAEKEGFLMFPNRSISGEAFSSPQGLADLVRSEDGLIFLSHLEERMDWEIQSITGNEIYNTHADVKDEARFLAMLSSPPKLLGLLPTLQQYPQEMFGAILDYPADYLRRWDELCQQFPHTGVAANDAHHNQGIRARVSDDRQLAIEDLLGKPVATIDPEKVPLLKALMANRQAGEIVLELDLDPYERSFRHVSTHLLMPELTRPAVWDALKSGRAYVSFEWLADPTGFWFQAARGDQRWSMGSRIIIENPPAQPVELSAATPLPVLFKLLRNGQVIREHRGSAFSATVDEAGVYRLEAWLVVADELKPWILSNPIYLSAAES